MKLRFMFDLMCRQSADRLSKYVKLKNGWIFKKKMIKKVHFSK